MIVICQTQLKDAQLLQNGPTKNPKLHDIVNYTQATLLSTLSCSNKNPGSDLYQNYPRNQGLRLPNLPCSYF